MESLPFWREMETRFRALPDPANQLNASLGETTAAEHLDHLTSVLVFTILISVGRRHEPAKHGCRRNATNKLRDEESGHVCRSDT